MDTELEQEFTSAYKVVVVGETLEAVVTYFFRKRTEGPDYEDDTENGAFGFVLGSIKEILFSSIRSREKREPSREEANRMFREILQLMQYREGELRSRVYDIVQKLLDQEEGIY